MRRSPYLGLLGLVAALTLSAACSSTESIVTTDVPERLALAPTSVPTGDDAGSEATLGRRAPSGAAEGDRGPGGERVGDQSDDTADETIDEVALGPTETSSGSPSGGSSGSTTTVTVGVDGTGGSAPTSTGSGPNSDVPPSTDSFTTTTTGSNPSPVPTTGSPTTTRPPTTVAPPTTAAPTTSTTVATSAPPPAGAALRLPQLRNTSTPGHLLATGTSQRTLVVQAAGGSDSNPGTQAQPFATLRRALEVVVPGDTVLVRNGVYSAGRGGPVLTRSGSASAWITIAAWPGERPIVRPAEGSGIRLEAVSYVEIRGIEFDGPPGTDYGSGIRLANGSHHVRLVDNVTHGWAGSGIATTDSVGVVIEGNVVYDNAARSPFQTSGISMYQARGPVRSGFDNVIRWNVVYGNENITPRPDGQLTDGNCVIIDDFRNEQGGNPHPPYTGSTLVAANSCFDNGGRGVLVYKSDNVHVEANILHENLLTPSINGGELTAAQASAVTFENNLVVADRSRPAFYVAQSSGVQTRDNVIVSDRSDDAGATDQWFPRGTAGVPDPITRVDHLPGR